MSWTIPNTVLGLKFEHKIEEKQSQCTKRIPN